jgi:hypothetical protein
MCAVTVRMTNSTRVKDGMRHRERTLEQYGVNSPRFDSRASPHQKEKGRGVWPPGPMSRIQPRLLAVSCAGGGAASDFGGCSRGGGTRSTPGARRRHRHR